MTTHKQNYEGHLATQEEASIDEDKFGLADRLRDSAALIKDQIGGEEGDAVFLDLELLADEIEEMESWIENGNGKESGGWLMFDDGSDPERVRRNLLEQGVGFLKKQFKLLWEHQAKNTNKERKHEQFYVCHSVYFSYHR